MRGASWISAVALLLPLYLPAAAADLACQPLTLLPVNCTHMITGDDNFVHEYRVHARLTGGVFYNISVETGFVYQTGWVTDDDHIGNAVAPYWMGRLLANFTGLGFKVMHSKDDHDFYHSQSFLKFLPMEVPRSTCPDLPRLEKVCNAHHGESLKYPHNYAHYAPMRAVIQRDMKEAYFQWANSTNFTVPTFESGDILVQDRCDRHTLLSHILYGPVGYSTYAALPTLAPKRVFITWDPNNDNGIPFQPCLTLHEDLRRHLATLAPSAQILDLTFQDLPRRERGAKIWGWVLLAPIFFPGVSTFGTWGSIANENEVYHPFVAFHHPWTLAPDYADFGPKWHWTNASCLRLFMAEKLRLNLTNVEGIMQWLREH